MPRSTEDSSVKREGSPERKERRKHKSDRPRRKTSKTLDDEVEREGSKEGRRKYKRSSSSGASDLKRQGSAPVPELTRRPSLLPSNDSRVSLPYPSLSKAHAREAVNSKEDLPSSISSTRTSELKNSEKRSPKKERVVSNASAKGPPSPPPAADSRTSIVEEKRRRLERQGEDIKRSLTDSKERSEPRGSASRPPQHSSPLRTSQGRRPASSPQRASSSRSATKIKPIVDELSVSSNSSISRSQSSRSAPTDNDTKPTIASSVDSGRTSLAPKQVQLQSPFSPDADDEHSPLSDTDSSLKTPTPRGTPFQPDRKQRPAYNVPYYNFSTPPLPMAGMPPPPPPPPPPPMVNAQPPRVDYLMQHGGLNRPVPKSFLATIDADEHSQPFAVGEMPDATNIAQKVQKLFNPFSSLLEDYSRVMDKNGSIAVATGYRSIARRLLDRLEAIFARDISSEACTCSICELKVYQKDDSEVSGLSWGEILEFVSGRRELPAWPAFTIDETPAGLGILEAPMQKLDIDVPEEYRDHYVRQSKKTKLSVDRWLAGQTENLSSTAPTEADDDTLTFAILTHLEEDQRPDFKQLLGVMSTRPPSVAPSVMAQGPDSPMIGIDRKPAPTALNAPRSSLLTRTSFAIKRLYRLQNPPRAPEAAIYLVKNPSMHNVLATLAAVSDHEWDILTSGRFDGFLRSGAEDAPAGTRTYSPVYSRGPTPSAINTQSDRIMNGAIPSRTASRAGTATPATPGSGGSGGGSAGAPVALDEETEIAILAEVERDIFLGMEALEDAFEALHCQAEAVRKVMRERGAGLSMAAMIRRGGTEGIEARLGTPASVDRGTPLESVGENGYGHAGGPAGVIAGMSGVSGEEWGFVDDGRSEIVPDDSASNVSRARHHRRKKRGEERRTPAPIEEENEAGTAEKPTGSGRRR